MFLTAWRDLQFRRRRVAIAVVGTAMVFALSLVMSGISASFGNEAKNAVGSFEAEGFLRPVASNGAFIAAAPFPIASAPNAKDLGATRADPVVFRSSSVGRGPKDKLAYFGVVRGGVGDPTPNKGRKLQADGEVIVDKKFGRALGDTISLGGLPLKVVGIVSKRSLLAGVPLAYVSLRDGQKMSYGGQDLANTIAVQGTALSPPPGWAIDTPQQVQAEMLLPLGEAVKTIDLVKVLLWIVAALIVGSVMYLQALERTRDFAVLKATGSSSVSIGGSLAIQAVFLCLIASAFAVVIAMLLAPRFSMNVEISNATYVAMPAVAVAIGFIAVLTGLRRSLSVEPAFAFRGA
jgi:putative ABC transport system permease protein